MVRNSSCAKIGFNEDLAAVVDEISSSPTLAEQYPVSLGAGYLIIWGLERSPDGRLSG